MSFWIEGVAIPIVSSFGLAGESVQKAKWWNFCGHEIIDAMNPSLIAYSYVFTKINKDILGKP